MTPADIQKRALPIARNLAAYACDNADPDSDPALVALFQDIIAAFGQEMLEAGREEMRSLERKQQSALLMLARESAGWHSTVDDCKICAELHGLLDQAIFTPKTTEDV